jgi:hypothetical protein
MNAVFDSGVEEFGMAFLTFFHTEVICGSWTSSDNVVASDFGEISYPFSTIQYEYTAVQKCDVSTVDGVVSESSFIPDGLHYSKCCKTMKGLNRKVLWRYCCPGSGRYGNKFTGRNNRGESTTHKTNHILDTDHLHNSSLNWLPGLLYGILMIFDIVMSFFNVFVDPSYIICICITLVFRLMCYALKALLEAFCDFVWDTWYGKYLTFGHSSLRRTMFVIFVMACSAKPFFIVSGSDSCGGDGCVLEFTSELPSTAESLLEQAKRLSREYTIFVSERRKRQRKDRYENDRERVLQNQAKYDTANKEIAKKRMKDKYDNDARKRRKDRYENDRERVLQNQAIYDRANKETINNRKRVSYRANKETINNRKRVSYQMKKSNCEQSNTRDCGDTDDFDSFLRFLDVDHREKILREHLKRIGHQLDATSVNGDINKQKANVCVVCDQIIFAAEPVRRLTKACLLENSERLCISQYQQHFGIQLHPELVRQYQVSN